jgi:hypothetical protein
VLKPTTGRSKLQDPTPPLDPLSCALVAAVEKQTDAAVREWLRALLTDEDRSSLQEPPTAVARTRRS